MTACFDWFSIVKPKREKFFKAVDEKLWYCYCHCCCCCTVFVYTTNFKGEWINKRIFQVNELKARSVPKSHNIVKFMSINLHTPTEWRSERFFSFAETYTQDLTHNFAVRNLIGRDKLKRIQREREKKRRKYRKIMVQNLQFWIYSSRMNKTNSKSSSTSSSYKLFRNSHLFTHSLLFQSNYQFY